MSKQNRSRAVQVSHPVKPRSSAMLAPVRRVATIVRVEVGEWDRVPNLDCPTESCTVTAVLSDGRRIERVATVEYQRGERERIIEAVLSGKGTDEDVRAAQRLLFRRTKAMERVRGKLQREFGRGVPWVDMAEAVA